MKPATCIYQFNRNLRLSKNIFYQESTFFVLDKTTTIATMINKKQNLTRKCSYHDPDPTFQKIEIRNTKTHFFRDFLVVLGLEEMDAIATYSIIQEKTSLPKFLRQFLEEV